MTDEQKAAYVNAQAALLNARIAKMRAANTEAKLGRRAPVYKDSDFQALLDEFSHLNHNYLISFFHP
jgi:hypothetical protein